jgi:protocatechuate 3,4-dioxygenase beta subunit
LYQNIQPVKRSDFLKGLGIVGAGALMPLRSLADEKPTACSLIPAETEGPFPTKQLSSSGVYFRKNIIEDRTGTRLNVKLKITGVDNCLPMQGLFVDIWHCDKDGVYSSYASAQNPGGTASSTWLRGYQVTDANGIIEFETIFPGWYSGRICHIHFQIHSVITESTFADGRISQFTFDIATKNAIYAANSVYTKGTDPMALSSDNIFSDGYSLQMCTLTPNSSINGYDAYLEVTTSGAGTTRTDDVVRGTGGMFVLEQNYPNPYSGTTTIPFTLVKQSDVRIDLYDMNGRLMHTVKKDSMEAGKHTIGLNLDALGLPLANYVYKILISNQHGVFSQAKIMTAIR